MARARNIKPAFFQNDDLGELDPLARLLFIGMWTIADFKGCLEFRPKRIKAQILPYDDCDIESLTNNLDKSGFISIYSVQGQQYLKIINFEKHQNPHKNEKESGSEVPDITEKDNEIIGLKTIENNPDKNGTARADSLLLNPDSLIPQPDSGLPKNTTAGADLFAGIDAQVVSDFKSLRMGKKAKITKTAMDGINREAEKAGLSLEGALKICCERGWTGFNADWIKQHQFPSANGGSRHNDFDKTDYTKGIDDDGHLT